MVDVWCGIVGVMEIDVKVCCVKKMVVESRVCWKVCEVKIVKKWLGEEI